MTSTESIPQNANAGTVCPGDPKTGSSGMPSFSSAILNGCGRNDLAFINRSISRVVQLLVVIILLESKFGMNAVNNLKKTTKIKLKRKLLGDKI